MDPHVGGARTLQGTVVAPQYSDVSSSHSNPQGDGDQSQLETPDITGRFQCLVCQQTFSRVEHLTRHERIHAKERSLKCRDCHKGFYRVDALRRHEQVHKQIRRSSRGKGARACDACAQARRKCSGERPCLGCKKRSLECTYLRISAGSGTGKIPMGWTSTSATAMFNQREQLQTGNILGSNEHTRGSLQEPGASMSNTSILVPNNRSHDQPQPAHNQEIIPQRFATFGENFMSPSATFIAHPVTENGQEMTSILTGEEHASPSSSNSDLIPDTELGHSSEGISDSNAWYQNNLSSINWLPDGHLPNYNQEPQISLGLFGNTSHIGIPNIHQISHTRSSNITGLSESLYSNPSSHIQSQGRVQLPLIEQITSPIRGVLEASSPESQNARGTSGRFYVDGDGARLPHIGSKRAKGTSRVADSLTPVSAVDTQNAFNFPQTGLPDTSPVNLKLIKQDIYNEQLSWFNRLCLTSSHFSTFRTATFPSLQTMSLFVSHYTEFFQPILPFTHPSTFDAKTADWLLILAMAAIGSHYIDIEDAGAYSMAMHEFLRRVISTLIETEDISKFDTVLFTQAQILNCVGMMYCGDGRLMQIAKMNHARLAAFCSNEWTKFVSDPMTVDPNNVDFGHDWRVWYEGETRRRTGYSIWLLDCMWSFHFQMRPQLSLQDARVPVPCQEVLWEAPTAREWHQLYSCSSPSPSLHSAIQLVYVEKRLQPSMGEFSRILLIHALFRRTWEVEDYFEQPLTLWSPTAEKQEVNTLHSLVPVWLPGIPTYSKWRNSACDCLDILHWHANSVIGAASGMEHTTVLHLHLARVVLLTPFRRIVNLALFMAGETSPSSEADIVAHRKHILRWATEDQYKARLAMIHAGVLFWHVRRYSADGFYEASSVFLATLALWAYGSFAQHTFGATYDRESTPSEDADSYPTSMQLDRPADDELVQLFVRRGAAMRANITRVGNICSENGPRRVLLEGRKLLLGLKSWGYSRRALDVLTALEQRCQ